MIQNLLRRLTDRVQPATCPRLRLPVKAHTFAQLQEVNTPIGSIIDVGVQACTSELAASYPGHFHLLIEPVAEFHEVIAAYYGARGVAHAIVGAAVAERDGVTPLETSTLESDKTVTHSRIVGPDAAAGSTPNIRMVPMRTLDTIIAEHQPPAPYLLKIDIDGGELQALQGATETLKQSSVVVMESDPLNFEPRFALLRAAGFEIFDIVDLCYYRRRFVQADYVFLNRAHVDASAFQFYGDGLNIDDWYIHAG